MGRPRKPLTTKCLCGCGNIVPTKHSLYLNTQHRRAFHDGTKEAPRLPKCLCGCGNEVPNKWAKYLNKEHMLAYREEHVKVNKIDKFQRLMGEGRKNNRYIMGQALKGNVPALKTLMGMHVTTIFTEGKSINLQELLCRLQ